MNRPASCEHHRAIAAAIQNGIRGKSNRTARRQAERVAACPVYRAINADLPEVCACCAHGCQAHIGCG